MQGPPGEPPPTNAKSEPQSTKVFDETDEDTEGASTTPRTHHPPVSIHTVEHLKDSVGLHECTKE
eukprot:7052187-Karenia_brevis.AAC.1